MSIQILHETPDFIVVNKAANMPSQPDKTETPSILTLLEAQIGQRLYLIHRLDRVASGVILFAKTEKAAANLSRQFLLRTVEKKYLAIVENAPPSVSGSFEHYLKQNTTKNRSYAYTDTQKNAKKALLEYKQIAASDRYFLIEVNLLTGRHHQIRAQFAAEKMYIRGDVKYGAKRVLQDRSISLLAKSLSFEDPTSGEKMFFEAPFPEDALWQYFENMIAEAKA